MLGKVPETICHTNKKQFFYTISSWPFYGKIKTAFTMNVIYFFMAIERHQGGVCQVVLGSSLPSSEKANFRC